MLEASLPFAAAVKPNLAFFEAYGAEGIAALERLRALVPADVPFVADAKRGDIGTTAARQAAALYDVLGADAVTVNPYLGEEAVAPLLERGDRFAYVLCRTSNPGAAEIQGLEVAADAAAGQPAEPLWARVARRVTRLGTRRDGRARRRRHRARRDGRHPGDRAGARVPRPGRRGAGRRGRAGARGRPRDRGSCGRTRRRRPARQRLPRASPARPWTSPDRVRSSDPGERVSRQAARRVGRQARCATLTPFRAGRRGPFAHEVQSHMPFINGIGARRAHHHPDHRA